MSQVGGNIWLFTLQSCSQLPLCMVFALFSCVSGHLISALGSLLDIRLPFLSSCFLCCTFRAHNFVVKLEEKYKGQNLLKLLK